MVGYITCHIFFREKYKDYNEKNVNLKGENYMKVTVVKKESLLNKFMKGVKNLFKRD